MNDPVLKKIRSTAFRKEFRNIAQGDKMTGEKGMNSIFVMYHNEIRAIPKDRVVTYVSVIVDYRSQKDNPNWFRIIAGGNLIKYPGELAPQTANLTMSKVPRISLLNTKDAKFMGINIKSFYLETLLDHSE